MTDEVLRGCKKYVVERVVNPGVYCMSKLEETKFCKKEIQRFEHFLAKNVEKFSLPGKITIGEVVAVKDDKGFHRGLVTDVFNRSFETTYCISLIDYENVVETKGRNVYLIKNKDLCNKQLCAFEVSIHGIQPTVVELKCDNNFLGGIFQKSVSRTWSPSAFQYVRDIIKKDPYVFVKNIHVNNRSISGEIYFIEEPGKVPVSLGKRLCDKGFAVYSEAPPKVVTPDSLQGYSDSDIEEKIPDSAVIQEVRGFEVLKNFREAKNERSGVRNLKDLVDGNVSLPKQELFKSENKSSSLSSTSSVSQGEGYGAGTNTSYSSTNYSSSWILKKCHINGSVPPPPWH